MEVPRDVFKNWTIVVVDDEPDTTLILREVLQEYGAIVQTANHAQFALALIHEHNPKFVITDLMMPGISGIDLLEHLQTAGADLARIPVIGATAYLQAGDTQRFLQLGFRYYITKPVIPSKVVMQIVMQLKDDMPELRARLDPPE